MSEEIYDEAELRAAICPLIDFTVQEDFSIIEEVEGTEVAMAYAVALNCVEALSERNQDDWLIELIRLASLELTKEGHERLLEQPL